jgi:hypothetical protein
MAESPKSSENKKRRSFPVCILPAVFVRLAGGIYHYLVVYPEVDAGKNRQDIYGGLR